MKPNLTLCVAAVLAILMQVQPLNAVAGTAESQATALYGSAWSPKLGAWLPAYGYGFDAWQHGQTAISIEDDYFICGTAPRPSPTATRSFYFAGVGCPGLKNATFFVYGEAGPPKGHILYDSSHGLTLFSEGCCAWGHVVLAIASGPPPKSVSSADLSNVTTMRGVKLGMTPSQVIAIYGVAKTHGVAGAPKATMLSYTNLKQKPSHPGNKCGQFQNFVFRGGRLIYIELLAGC